MNVNDAEMQNANLTRLVMQRMQNVSNVKKLVIMEKFVPKTEADRLLQVPSEVDAFEFQVLMTALQLRRGDRVCEPFAFERLDVILVKHAIVAGGNLITKSSHGWPPYSQQQVPETSIDRSADLGQTHGTRFMYVASLDQSSSMAATCFQV